MSTNRAPSPVTRPLVRRAVARRMLVGAAGLALLARPAGAQSAPARGAITPAQPDGPLWTSHRRAVDLVSRAVAAHGGTAALAKLGTVSWQWEGRDFAPSQGRVPTVAWEPAVNARAASQRVTMDAARERLLVDLDFSFFGGYRNRVRIAANGRTLVSFDPAGEFNGTTFGRDTAGVAARAAMASYSRTMPPLLLARATNRVATLRMLGERTVAGRRESTVSFTEADGAMTTIIIDAISHLVVGREEFGIGSLGDEVDAQRFSQYERVEGIMVPRRLEERWNGRLAGERRLTSFTTQATVPDSVLAPPAGYVAAPPPAGPSPVMTKVADRVWYVERIGGGYRSLLVDTDSGLALVDAPVGAGATQAALALIERTLPARPLRWVAVTHHHGDHISGLPTYVARGATVLVAPGSERYVAAFLTAPRTLGRLLPTARTDSAAPCARVEGVRGRRVFGSGEHRVEIIDVGPTSHAASMLVAWVPSQRLLFQGDLLRVNEHGGAAVSPDATRDLERIVTQHAPDAATIGSVHGRNATMAELRATLARDAAAAAATATPSR